jgi:phosphatidylethanolamine-binding protein (PEBP) family uncharacterized protein
LYYFLLAVETEESNKEFLVKILAPRFRKEGCCFLLEAKVKIPLSDKENEMLETTLTSESFIQDGLIPIRHTCDGQDISPGLSWTRIPEGTQSLVLIVDDPDAPDPADPGSCTIFHLRLMVCPKVLQ